MTKANPSPVGEDGFEILKAYQAVKPFATFCGVEYHTLEDWLAAFCVSRSV
jgi:hypothetical protein